MEEPTDESVLLKPKPKREQTEKQKAVWAKAQQTRLDNAQAKRDAIAVKKVKKEPKVVYESSSEEEPIVVMKKKKPVVVVEESSEDEAPPPPKKKVHKPVVVVEESSEDEAPPKKKAIVQTIEQKKPVVRFF